MGWLGWWGAVVGVNLTPFDSNAFPPYHSKINQVAMNTVDSMENFLADVAQGRWEAVLPQVAGLRLPQDKLLGA